MGAGLRLRSLAERRVMRGEGKAKFKGRLDAAHIRGDKKVKKRKNLGASFLERLRGKFHL